MDLCEDISLNDIPLRLFKRTRADDSESLTSDSSSLLMLPPPPPFNSPAEGYAMPDEHNITPRTKARKLRDVIQLEKFQFAFQLEIWLDFWLDISYTGK